MKKLIIVGCGPKAIAIAAKAHTLKKLGWKVPDIAIIDKHGPAANWDGTNGYTDGVTVLGTTPFEDVGFPYDSQIDNTVDIEMLKLSYMGYLVDKGRYAEWVDRLLTPPTHGMLADYLKWVVNKIDIPVIVGDVTDILVNHDKWTVLFKHKSGKEEIVGDSLVITGAGHAYKFPRTDKSLADNSRVLNGQNIWHSIDQFKDIKNAKIAVIGGGETSAGIVTALLKIIDGSSQIEIITKHPILFTRNENWMEVMYFSKVMDWPELSDEQKIAIIRHGDRNTFSVAAKHLVDSAYNVSLKMGKATAIEVNEDRAFAILDVNGTKQKQEYDYIIEATGFDPFSFMELFSDKSLISNLKSLPSKIDSDLSVKDFFPKLHLPGLSAMAQGPGFPNLSCLGLLAERILIPYIDKPSQRPK